MSRGICSLLFHLAAEGENLLDQVLGPQPGLADLIEITGEVGIRRTDVDRHLRIADDRAEDIIEIMGDSAGQGADRLHLLGMDQLGLEPALLILGQPLSGDVEQEVEDRRFAGPLDIDDVQLDPANITALWLNAERQP